MKLSPTSYLLLSLMELKPWTGYELAEQMTRGVEWMWPRGERAFYYEAKKLAEAGYASAERAEDDGRNRSVYSITPKGSEALTDWLSGAPPQAPRFESEAVLRLFFADHGEPEDARAAAQSLVEVGQSILIEARAGSLDYLGAADRFPERSHLVAIIARFMVDLGLMLERFGLWADDVIAEWDHTDSPDAWPDHRVEFERAVAESDRLVEEPPVD